jgi:trehalose monomycolate/heme transporter
MFSWWGGVVNRFRWPVLAVAVAFMAFAGIWGTGAFSRLSGDTSLNDPSSQSQQISQHIVNAFGQEESVDIVALYTSTQYSPTDAPFRDAVTAVETRLRADPNVAQVQSYYDTNSPSFISHDDRSTYLAIRLVTGYSSGQAKQVRHDLAAGNGVTEQVGGSEVVNLDISGLVGSGIALAESTSMPLLCLLLILAFGNVVAALMPILVGGVAILGAFTAVRIIEIFTSVSIFSINIITILGLGLAVDYGLFIVSRYREELDRGKTVPDALSRTMATAGRTVAVSGLLVGLALCSLLIFPQVLLRSMGFGGAAAVLVAMVASLTVLPAVLALLGHRIDKWALPWAARKRRAKAAEAGAGAGAAVAVAVTKSAVSASADEGGRWAAIANSVMRRPVPYLVGVLVIIGVVAWPVASIHFGGIDQNMLPSGTQSRVVADELAADFPGGNVSPIRVLISGADAGTAKAFEQRIASVPGITAVSVTAQNTGNTLFAADFAGDASAPAAQHLVTDIRALAPPAGSTVMVGGTSAGVVDQLASLGARLPWMLLMVGVITFLILAVGFGSVLVPIKAIVMNLLSISAAFGAVTWIFQDGHLSGPLGFTGTGYVEASQPVLMLAILFGLSMDYEVFLVSRIRERWDDLGDNRAAVASGVQRTGRIITTAALLLCIVVGAFTSSGITFLKMIGVGMVVALLIDATLVRLLLVPATMRLLGRFNWWAPRFLQTLYGRYGFREEDGEPVGETQLPADGHASVLS